MSVCYTLILKDFSGQQQISYSRFSRSSELFRRLLQSDEALKLVGDCWNLAAPALYITLGISPLRIVCKILQMVHDINHSQLFRRL